MGHGRHICDLAYTNAQRLDCTNCSFPTRTRTLDEQFSFLKTHLLAAFTVCSAAILAANGVLLRDPLKPADPELPQQMVLPCKSVMVTMVLLKDAKTCTCPVEIWRLTLREVVARRAVRACFAIILPHLIFTCLSQQCSRLPLGRKGTPPQACCSVHYYFLVAPRRRPRPATVRLGPLRVRALVRVF